MKKKLTIIASVIVLLGGIGFGVYRAGMNMASDKLIQSVSTELKQSGDMAAIKKSIENDPNLKKSIENDPQFKKLMVQSKADSTNAGKHENTGKSENAGNSKNSIDNQTSAQKHTGNLRNTTAPVNTNQSVNGQNSAPADSQSNNDITSNGKKLPFNTKEGAAKVLISRIGLSELKSMYSKVKAGMMTKAQVLRVLRSKLTRDEITALKLVAYQELLK